VNEALWALVKPISVVLLSISNKRSLLLKAASVDGDYIQTETEKAFCFSLQASDQQIKFNESPQSSVSCGAH